MMGGYVVIPRSHNTHRPDPYCFAADWGKGREEFLIADLNHINLYWFGIWRAPPPPMFLNAHYYMLFVQVEEQEEQKAQSFHLLIFWKLWEGSNVFQL